jgi:hypothetical protein
MLEERRVPYVQGTVITSLKICMLETGCMEWVGGGGVVAPDLSAKNVKEYRVVGYS